MHAPERIAAIQEKIAAFVQASLPDASKVTIGNLRRVAGGMSTENWLFDGRWELPGRIVQEPMVLRCAAETEIVEATREHEFLLLTALSHAGLPVPRTFWMDRDGEWMGAPAMVLERCVGRADRALLQERNSLGLDLPARRHVAEQMADVLADIHKVEIGTIAHLRAGEHESSPSPAEQELAIQDTALRRDDWPPDPELVLAARWLRAHLPVPPEREVVVHGDFRPANMLVEAGTLTAVLDWELAHRGDPAEDLGWYLAPVYRHEHFIPGQWNPEDFLNRYEQRSGIQVDPAAVRFWSVFATYKLAVIALHSARSLAAGDHARLGPPAHRLVEALMRAIAVTEKP